MNNHTVSLEIAKRMKGLGWGQETLFSWFDIQAARSCECIFQTDEVIDRSSRYNLICSAPIATEILDKIPSEVNSDDYPYYLMIDKSMVGGSEKYCCFYEKMWEPTEDDYVETVTEALALLWIQLVEEGIIITNKE